MFQTTIYSHIKLWFKYFYFKLQMGSFFSRTCSFVQATISFGSISKLTESVFDEYVFRLKKHLKHFNSRLVLKTLLWKTFSIISRRFQTSHLELISSFIKLEQFWSWINLLLVSLQVYKTLPLFWMNIFFSTRLCIKKVKLILISRAHL